MGNFFMPDFVPSVKLGEIKEKPIENGLQYLTDFFNYFGIVDKEEVGEAIAIFHPKIFKKGSYYLRPGQVCDRIGLITHGAVEAFYRENNKDHILLLLLEEDFFTDLRSFIHQKQSSLYLQFTEDSIVLEVTHADFKDIIQKHPVFAEMFMKIMSNVLGAINAHNLLLKLPTKSRYEQMLKKKPQIFNRFLLQDIASFLGIKQETLSRARSNYKKTYRSPSF